MPSCSTPPTGPAARCGRASWTASPSTSAPTRSWDACRGPPRCAASSASAPLSLGLRGGMERLTSTLAAKLDVRLSTGVDAVTRSEHGRLSVAVRQGDPLEADAVVLAIPAPQAATILQSAPRAASELAQVR